MVISPYAYLLSSRRLGGRIQHDGNFPHSGLNHLYKQYFPLEEDASTKSQANRKPEENRLHLKRSSERLFPEFHLPATSASKKFIKLIRVVFKHKRWGRTLPQKKQLRKWRHRHSWAFTWFWNYKERFIRSGYPACSSLPSLPLRKALCDAFTVW